MRAFFALLVVALANSSHAPSALALANSSHAPSAPIIVSWEAVELTDTHAALVAHVKRVAAVPYPLSVRIDLPAGVSLSAGRASFEVPRNEAPDEVTEALEVTYSRRPVNSLILRVSGGTRAGGVSAAIPYGFGRIEVKTKPVAPAGDSVVMNGRDLGASVPLRQR